MLKKKFHGFFFFFFFELSDLLIQFPKTASLFSLGSTEGCNKVHVATRFKAECVRIIKIITSESDILNLPCTPLEASRLKKLPERDMEAGPRAGVRLYRPREGRL